MTETELLRLPEIPEGPPAEQLKAMKRYLCRLAEQLEYILTMLKEQGEDTTFRYIRQSVLKNKPFPWD